MKRICTEASIPLLNCLLLQKLQEKTECKQKKNQCVYEAGRVGLLKFYCIGNAYAYYFCPPKKKLNCYLMSNTIEMRLK